MHDIYKLKDMLCDELEEYGKKGEITTASLDLIDKLAHTVKNLDKIIKYHEEEQDGYSENYPRRMYRDGYGDLSYARRGRNVRRDSMGRYSSGGYSMAEDDMKDMLEDMREMMRDLPQEKKMEVQKFINKMEQM